jgi:uncharacterized protein YfdQ (DUF2303 family)
MTTTNNMGASEVEAVARIVHEAGLGKPVLMSGEVDEEGVWTVTTPAGWQREFFTVEPAMPCPAMSRGEVCVHNAVSFAAAVLQRRLAELLPVIYADETALSLVAVLNDDHDVTPGWRDYRVRLALRRSPEWEAWRAVDTATCAGGLLSQEAFAEFVEDHLADIVEPAAADMLEIAQTFHATVASNFRQGARLRDGRRQFNFEEDIDAKGGETGEMVIPATVRLRLRLFVGGGPVATTARLRWRLREGKLTLGFKLDQPDDLERVEFTGAVVSGVEEALSLTAIAGVAPKQAVCREPAHRLGGDV